MNINGGVKNGTFQKKERYGEVDEAWAWFERVTRVVHKMLMATT